MQRTTACSPWYVSFQSQTLTRLSACWIILSGHLSAFELLMSGFCAWFQYICLFVTKANVCTPCLNRNVPPLACYNFDAHERILGFFGKNVTSKVDNQKTLYYATLNNLCFCTTWQSGEHENQIFTQMLLVGRTLQQLDCVARTMHQCTVFLKEKIVICDVFDSI